MLIKTLAILLVLVATSASAKNLYVDVDAVGGCSDATTYDDNTASAPWCTIGRAAWGQAVYSTTGVSAQAAQANDIVYVAEGIYWEDGPLGNGVRDWGTGQRFVPALSPVNDGTSASEPIIFQGVGTVQVRLNFDMRGPMIGCSSGTNYIFWKNFYVDDYYGGSVPDTGPVFFGGTGCRLEDSTVLGHSGTYYHGYEFQPVPPDGPWYPSFVGNYRLVGMEGSTGTEVRNNTIHRALGYYGAGGGQNEAGIMTYSSRDAIIENNLIYNTGQGIFLKGVSSQTQTNNITRYNEIRDSRNGIRVLDATDTLIYQNIVHSGTVESSGLWAGHFGSTRSRFVNNTVYGAVAGITPQGSDLDDVQFLNNIIVGSTVSAIYNWTEANPSTHDVSYDRNLYYDNPYIWQNEGGTNLNFAQFQAYGHEADGLSGSDPLFTNAATFDFTLQSGSPALTLGRTITAIHGTSGTTIPAGAYITGSETIGLTTGAPAVNGACGTNNNATLASLTSANANNCATGTVSSFTAVSGGWEWGCAGSNGGTSVTNCAATQQAVGGGTGRAPYSATARVPYSATSFARYYEANP